MRLSSLSGSSSAHPCASLHTGVVGAQQLIRCPIAPPLRHPSGSAAGPKGPLTRPKSTAALLGLSSTTSAVRPSSGQAVPEFKSPGA
ncbi:hypothetical protein NDU88_001997 [Pleurodeles waltl]|uniref:Uncharacterized protein n=1 Tax=Pleurodeles waltl TaxID=8319 RepID=A0AAV7W0J8_PLEWA|nr:hypothetical protein NDU88_001997 [Pleurodeles waltl]